MKFIRSLYHFLGGIYFALILISAVALFVIAGTFIESLTQSHRYAALFTYDNPLFAVLLWGFFINILFSATRRWPFRWKHIPFLTTHLGLLMILAGVLAKHYFGLQGSMSLYEGTGSNEIMESNTLAIHVEGKTQKNPMRYPIKKIFGGSYAIQKAAQDDSLLSLRLMAFTPHCKEHLISWVKGSHAYIAGLKPMPLHEVSFEEDKLPVGGRTKFHPSGKDVWELYALKTTDMEKTLSKLYAQNAHILIKDRQTQEVVHDATLENMMIHKTDDGNSAALTLNFSVQDGCQGAKLQIAHAGNLIIVPLAGNQALLNLYPDSDPELGNLPFAIDIIQQPFLAVIEDSDENVFLAAIDPHGKVWTKPFLKGNLDSIVAYDDGFAGYTVRTNLPIKAYRTGRQEREDVLAYQLNLQLRQAVAEGTQLSPPLQLMLSACQKSGLDFPETATAFLVHWNHSNHWLYQETIPLTDPLKLLVSAIDWKETPRSTKQACEWVKCLFDQITPNLKKNNDLMTTLRNTGWPLISALEAEIAAGKDTGQDFSEYTLVTHQLFAASEAVKPVSANNTIMDTSAETQAVLLSAYLRAYGIHLSSILPVPAEDEMNKLLDSYQAARIETAQSDPIALETTVVPLQKTIPPTIKLEENTPKITLLSKKGQQTQRLSLSYDHTGKGLKWPILNGEYLVRFQPMFIEIPYRLRLRQARQINYANSLQPFSFESELIFTDRRTNTITEKTISMNKVHETWDGYRFYLSSITPQDETAVKHVQIVVNYDPAKYVLTYPGAIVSSCGILMLFIMRPYRRSKQ